MIKENVNEVKIVPYQKEKKVSIALKFVKHQKTNLNFYDRIKRFRH